LSAGVTLSVVGWVVGDGFWWAGSWVLGFGGLVLVFSGLVLILGIGFWWLELL